MLCPACGRDLPDGTERCTRCGAQPEVRPADAPTAPPPAGDDQLTFDTQTEVDEATVPPQELVTALPTSAGGGPGQSAPEGRPFGPRYRILRTLGQGGMGEVYEAWDQELSVSVALKVIRRDLMQGRSGRNIEQRFKKELLLAREVTHRNVVRIHDLGDVDGVKYISMDYVSGSALSDLLKQHGALEVPRVLRYARQIASGLAAAHEAGVVHRDLKPANIVVNDDDEALIMDFGIARIAALSDQDGPQGAEPAPRSGTLSTAQFDTTSPGAIVGTAAYMAPEQAKGLHTDQRTDIYSFGLILYDSLTANRLGKTREEVRAEMKARLDNGLESLGLREPDLPAPVSQLVMRCLATDPAERFQSVDELLAALDELDEMGKLKPKRLRLGRSQLAAAATLVVTATSAIWWFTRPPPVLVQPDPISVLIADFENRTGEAAFDDVENAVAVGLEGASFIYAFPRGNALEVAGQMAWGDTLDETTARLVASRQGLNVIVTGVVTEDDGEYIISTTSLDALVATAGPLASVEVAARSVQDAPGALRELMSELRGALGDTTPESTRLAEVETFTSSSLEAIQAYSGAQALAQSGDNEGAIDLYQRAVELDPTFGRAYAGWATSALFAGQDASAIWESALALTDRMTPRERLRTIGVYHLGFTGDAQAAVATYTDLVEQYPADNVGHNNLAYSHFFVGDIPGALEAAEEGLRLFPNLLIARNNYALYAMYGGDFAGAMNEARVALDLDPTFFKNYLPIAVAAVAEMNDDAVLDAYESMAQARTSAADSRGLAHASIGLADYAMYRGRWNEAAQLLDAALSDPAQTAQTRPALAMQVARARVDEVLGDSQAAITRMQALVDSGNSSRVALVPASSLYVRQGQLDEAIALATELQNRVPANERAYGLILSAMVARAEGRRTDAIDLLREALALSDLWLAHYELGQVYLELEQAGSALGEFQACLDRRGEAAAIFLDDIPSYRYMAEVPYWLARAQAGIFNTSGARENFEAYIALRENADVPDPLVEDARERLAGL